MYSFADRDEAHTMIALRPEGTPGVVRAYIEARARPQPIPSSAFSTAARCSATSVRRRAAIASIYQFGVEIFGRADAGLRRRAADHDRRLAARTWASSWRWRSTRSDARNAVRRFARRCSSSAARICPSCARIATRGWSAIRCGCWTARSTRGSWKRRPKRSTICARPCRKHFDTVHRVAHKQAGVPYAINPRLVRGPRLLHAHHFRGGLDGGGRAEHGRSRAAATTGWSRSSAARRCRASASRSAWIGWRWRLAASGASSEVATTAVGDYRAGHRSASHGDARWRGACVCRIICA